MDCFHNYGTCTYTAFEHPTRAVVYAPSSQIGQRQRRRQQQLVTPADQHWTAPKRDRGCLPSSRNRATEIPSRQVFPSPSPIIADWPIPDLRSTDDCANNRMEALSEIKNKSATEDDAADRPAATIVGSYGITCEEISRNWPDHEELTMGIAESSSPGVCEGCFDFGAVEGVLLISTDQSLLDERVAELDMEDRRERDDYDYDEGFDEYGQKKDGEEDSREQPVLTGDTREAEPAEVAPEGQKAMAARSLKFRLLSRGQENGEGETDYIPCPGEIKFSDDKFTTFTGEMDICFLGCVEIVGERVSDAGAGGDWNAYTEHAYEEARVGRWR